MDSHNESLNVNAPYNSLKSLNNDKSFSPSRLYHPSAKKSCSPYDSKCESPSDFVDKHRTFYNSLLQKIKMDSSIKKINPLSNKDLCIKIYKKPVSNNTTVLEESPSRLNHIKHNISLVTAKPPVKNFKYLEENDKVMRAIEPKKLIKGVDELHQKISRIFMTRKRTEDEFPSYNQQDQKTTKLLDMKKLAAKPLKKKRSYSNIPKESKPQISAPDALQGPVYGIVLFLCNPYNFK